MYIQHSMCYNKDKNNCERRDLMSERHYPTDEEKEIMLNLYKCHFTAREVSEHVPFGYQTIQNYFRSFNFIGIQKYNRLDLMPEETHNDAECYS